MSPDELLLHRKSTLYLSEVKKEIGPGFWFGEIALFSHAAQKPVRAIAKTGMRCDGADREGSTGRTRPSSRNSGFPLLRS